MTESLHSQETDLKVRRTPLPVSQLSILLLLRFTESASTFVIFPFFSEVRFIWFSVLISLSFWVCFCPPSRVETAPKWAIMQDSWSVLTFFYLIVRDWRIYLLLQESIRQTLSLVSVMYWSRLSDHIGRKPILLLGTLALATSISSFGLSKTFLGLVVRYVWRIRPCSVQDN